MSDTSINNLNELVTPGNTDNLVIVDNSAGAETKRITFANLAAAIGDGSGNVSGPVSSTDRAIAIWNGTNGDTLQDTNVIIDSNQVMSGITTLQLNKEDSRPIIESIFTQSLTPTPDDIFSLVCRAETPTVSDLVFARIDVNTFDLGSGTESSTMDFKVRHDGVLETPLRIIGGANVGNVLYNFPIDMQSNFIRNVRYIAMKDLGVPSIPELDTGRVYVTDDGGGTMSLFFKDDQNVITNLLLTGLSGPVSSTDTAIAIWDGTNGDSLLNTGVLINSSDEISGVNKLTLSGDIIMDGFIDLDEIAFPSDPGGNVGRLYVRDDGTGTTALFFRDNNSVDTNLLLGEANTASNTQTDSSTQKGLVLAKSGVDLPFKVIRAGSNITLSSDATGVTINAPTSGDVTGPGSSTDNGIPTWDGTTGDTLQDTTVTIIANDMKGLDSIIVDGTAQVENLKLADTGSFPFIDTVFEETSPSAGTIFQTTYEAKASAAGSPTTFAQMIITQDDVTPTAEKSSILFNILTGINSLVPILKLDGDNNQIVFTIPEIDYITPTITENVIYDSTVERDVIQTGSAVTNLNIPVLSYEVQITEDNDDEPGIITAFGALGGTLTGYTDGESITLSTITGTGAGATATATIVLGDLTSITLTGGGTGYDIGDQLKITGDTSTADTATVTVADIVVPISIIQFDLERNDSSSITDRHLFSIVNNGSREWTIDHDGTVLQFGNLVMQSNEIQFEDDKHKIFQNGEDLEIQTTSAGVLNLINGVTTYSFGSVNANWNGNGLESMGILSFTSTDVKIQQSATTLQLHGGTGGSPTVDILVSSGLEYSFAPDQADFKENDLLVGNIEINKADDDVVFFISKFTQATPSADTIIFSLTMFGQNSGSAEKLYGLISVEQKIISPGSEDGIIEFGVLKNGGLDVGMSINGNTSKLALGDGFDISFTNNANDGTLLLRTDVEDNLTFEGDVVLTTGRSPSVPLDTDVFFFAEEGTDVVKQSTFDNLQFAIIAGHGNNDAVNASDKEFAFFNKGDGGTTASQFQFQMPATMEIRNLRVTIAANNRSGSTNVSVKIGTTVSSVLQVTFDSGSGNTTEEVVASETVTKGTTVTLFVPGDSSGNFNILGFSCLLGQRSV